MNCCNVYATANKSKSMDQCTEAYKAPVKKTKPKVQSMADLIFRSNSSIGYWASSDPVL